MTVPFPTGARIALDPGTRQLDARTLLGGQPMRLLRLSDTGERAFDDLRTGPVRSAAAGMLARRLVDAGAAHPRPQRVRTLDVTVLIPVHDRAAELEQCLAAQGDAHPVVVVDDASSDSAAVADVTRRHGAMLLRRETNGGPGTARNSGLAVIDSEFVAFLDSDCIPPAGWVAQLAGHFADPLVAAVAPRIVPADPATRYAAAYGCLDLGPDEARVVPSGRVGYLPTAALVVRRAALSSAGAAFDPTLRVGEDVDLVWRLHEAGWRVRYDPSVRVAHHEPQTWRATLGRRFRYGTSAAPLAERHPDALRHLVLQACPATTLTAALARRPLLAGLAFAGHTAISGRRLRHAGLPAAPAIPMNARAVVQTWLGVGRYACQTAAPLLITAMAARGERRWGRRAALASLLLAPACTPPRAPLPIPTRVLARLADDLAYGAGVWTGCLRHRTLRPFAPAIRRRSAGTERQSA